MKNNSKPEVKKKRTFERTIEPELFKAWKSKRRTGDVEELIKITGKSYPIISRALLYGHAPNVEVADAISTFFIERSKKEKDQAEKIKNP